MKQLWIVLGASSAMARAFARKAASEGSDLILAGRDMADLRVGVVDCLLRGAVSATSIHFDSRDPDSFEAILTAAAAFEGTINAAVFAGSMPSQSDIDANPVLAAGMIADNYMGPLRFLHELAPLLEDRKSGTIVGIGSVAGDRGRIKNYVYGSTKAAFHTYLAGLRNRLTRSSGHVLTVKPGFVDTAMTWGLPGMFLVASPDDIAQAIWQAVQKKRDVIYAPFFWRYIMLIICNIPERIFKKMSV